ncbi:MAG TPA: STELLO glycosyltransferase family protein [Pyrinomonadaceae bacterium]|nr:STELLO glycosyltransferase family protein [Pyrinomonadaceae bacterium]
MNNGKTLETPHKVALVVTSIAGPTQILQTFARGSQERGYKFIVIGDSASPAGFQLEGCRFYSLDQQYQTGFTFARQCPTKHYARKNLGYLLARRDGAEIILETDDDNLPYETFWRVPDRRQSTRTISNHGWSNVYQYYSEATIWPRGFPLDHVKDRLPARDSLPVEDTDCPIQQGLVNENPDVDAIYRLVSPLPQSFASSGSVVLAEGSWCPFNSQNTWWWRDAFPLLYLPGYSSFRMTDIWRSFVAQRIAWANNWSVAFHQPTAWQERNEHNLMRDFHDELPGYLHNKSICEELDKLQIRPGTDQLGNNLRVCYEQLVSMELLDRRELVLVDAWLTDLQTASE